MFALTLEEGALFSLSNPSFIMLSYFEGTYRMHGILPHKFFVCTWKQSILTTKEAVV